MKKNLPIGITMGDAAGIGPEILIQTYTQGLINKYSVVYGNVEILRYAANLLKSKIRIVSFNNIDEVEFQEDTIGVIECESVMPKKFLPGKVNPLIGKASFNYVKEAIMDALKCRIRAIVTAPLNKESMHKAGVQYPGHTEIFAKYTNTKKYAMLLSNRMIRVLLVTIHIPLSKVAETITLNKELSAIEMANNACIQLGIKHPKVAIAALNPHASEGGKFGIEESKFILPAIRLAQKKGINATGPWPSDTVFMKAHQGDFDIVVAQYHDQGLIPIKYLGLNHGVNITIGLPFVRTSVDHGTAFDIAWQGKANPESFIEAYNLALLMTSKDSY
ncbi:MAG: 4-hydroxythreonine-4-phosphate dehydrogenase PdxA [Bordetella sp.]|nr:MAG: 4-hydroxythreonine-4-phosphate dehydrogenase PdxA [Bordetella sp.]